MAEKNNTVITGSGNEKTTLRPRTRAEDVEKNKKKNQERTSVNPETENTAPPKKIVFGKSEEDTQPIPPQ